MIKNLFLVCASLLSLCINGQDKTKEEVIELIAEDTCKCMQDHPEDFSENVSLSKKEMSLGLCIINSFNVRKAQSSELKDKSINDLDEVSEAVGISLVSKCGNTFLSSFSNEELGSMLNEENDNLPPPPAPKNENDLQLEANLMSLNNDVISYIKVKDDFDKDHLFLINEQFEGFELLKKSNYGKDFKIYYKEIDLFDLSERKYVKKKIIKYLELI